MFQVIDIQNYIRENLTNEPAAYRFKQTIEQKFQNISNFPKSGTYVSLIADDISPEFSNVRKLTANRYVIIYEYYENLNIATVTHIFHQMQDYGKIFQNN